MAQLGGGGPAGGDAGKNIFNRALGAVPKPIRKLGAGALDVLDTPRAFTVSAIKEARDLNNSRGFSFNDLVQQTRANISAYEGLGLDRLGGPDWLGKGLGLGADLLIGAATMPGLGTVKAGETGLVRGAKLGTQTLARNAVELRTAAQVADLANPLSNAARRFQAAQRAVVGGGGTIEEGIQAGARSAIINAPEVKAAAQAGAKAIVRGQASLSKTELETLDRARRLMIGRTAIPGTEKMAQKVADTLKGILPKEALTRTFTRQGVAGAPARFAQNFDVIGQTGSRLRSAAIEAVDTGRSTRLIGEMQAAAVRSRGLGAGSIAAHELVEGSSALGVRGLKQDVVDTLGGKNVQEALRVIRSAPDRGAADMVASLAGPLAPYNRIGIVVRKTLSSIRAMDPQYWADNPDRWASAVGGLSKRAEDFERDILASSQLPGALRQAKMAAAGQRDVISDVLAPWVEDVSKEIGASKIADPNALIRLSVANDPLAIAAGAKTIKLGPWGEISEDTFKRVTGTYGGSDKVANFTKHVQGITNLFRSLALASPAFSNRNFLGGLLNNYANGVTLADTRWAAKQFRHFDEAANGASPVLRAAAARKLDPAFESMMARQGDALHTMTRGVETDPFAGRVSTMAQKVQQGLDKTPVGLRGAVTGTVNKAPVEVVLRGAAFKRGLAHGLTEEGAWAFAQKIHIDYQDLSSFDVAARRAVPFSMWATRNPGLQAEYLARGMGTGGSLETALLNSRQREEGSGFPPFIAGTGFALGGGDVLNLSALPSTDILGTLEGNRNIGEVLRDYLAQTNPAFQAGIELAAGNEMGSQRPLTPGRFAAGFVPPLNTLAAFTGQPPSLRSKSQLPGLAGLIGPAGAPASPRRYGR